MTQKKNLRYGVVPTWEEPSSVKQCTSPLKCIDGICKPQSCYSKRDCDRDEECFKWQQSSGICYRVECKKSSDCPPGHGCNSGICIKNFCSSNNDCGNRYKCLQGSCVLDGCNIIRVTLIMSF